MKHVARFWLRDPRDLARIERRIEQLAVLPQVVDIAVGPPLESNWGMRIDKSYDVGFVMTFGGLDDCRAYFENETHQRLAHELIELAERVEAFYIKY